MTPHLPQLVLVLVLALVAPGLPVLLLFPVAYGFCGCPVKQEMQCVSFHMHLSSASGCAGCP